MRRGCGSGCAGARKDARQLQHGRVAGRGPVAEAGSRTLWGTRRRLVLPLAGGAKIRARTSGGFRNAPGTELRGNHITGGTDKFWAVRLSEDRGADGRGTGIPSGIRIKGNVIRQAANGIRIDAGKNLCMMENVIDGIEGDELRVADGIEVNRSAQHCP